MGLVNQVVFFILGCFLGAVGLAVILLAIKAFRIIETDRSKKRQTNNTDAGLLDTMADLNLIEFNLIEINARLNTIYSQLGSAKKRAGIIRQGPYAYDKTQTSEAWEKEMEDEKTGD